MNKVNIFKKYLPWAWLIAGYIYDIAFILIYGRQMLDSDMSAEMVLSNLLNQEHSIVTHNWIYSTEIRVAETQWFFRIGLLLSPDNWIVARAIGTAIMLALYVCVWLLLSKLLEWGRTGVWICAMLVWPFGFWYFMDITWGAYYVPHSILMILSLALLISIAKKYVKEPRLFTVGNIIKILVIAAVSFICGLNGIRNTLIFYMPLMLFAVIVLYMHFREHGLKSVWQDISVKLVFARLAIGAVFCNLVGYVANHVLFEYKYSYSSYNNMTWGGGSGGWTTTFKWYIDSFGLKDQASKELFTLSGIGAGCGLLLGILLVISVIRLCMNYKKMNELNQLYIGLFLSMLFSIGAVFTYIYGDEQYWLTTIQFGVAAIFLEIMTEPALKRLERAIAPCFVLILAAVSTIGTTTANIESPLRANPDFENVIAFLEEKGYTQGCASFWRGPVITELTNGDIEMWNMTDEFNDVLLWLQHNSHRELPQGEFFCIYNIESESESVDIFTETYGLEGELVYQDDYYLVYEYNN